MQRRQAGPIPVWKVVDDQQRSGELRVASPVMNAVPDNAGFQQLAIRVENTVVWLTPEPGRLNLSDLLSR